MRKVLIILLLAILAASAGLAAAWQAQSETVMSSARGMLEEEATKSLGSAVSVGSVEIQGFNSILIKDINLRDKLGEIVATALSVSVSFNPLKFLTESNPVDAIHSVTVDSPRLYLRQRSDQTWNVEDFLKDQQPGKQQFSGAVRISRGWISIESDNIGSYQADTINGELDFRAKPSIQIDMKGNHNNAWFTIAGYVNGISRDALTISIDRLSMPNYKAALPADLLISAGEAKHITVTVIREKEELEYAGEASFENLSINTEGIIVDNASALVSFDQNSARIYNANLNVWGQPLWADGKVHYRGDQPVFDINVASESFDTSVLPMGIGLSGHAAFNVNVKGTPADISAQGEAAMPDGSYQNYNFSNASSRFVYSGGSLQLQGAKATIFNGLVTADGVIDIQSNKADLRISGRQLDGVQLAKLAGLAETGAIADFDLLLNGGLSLSTLDIAGSITLGKGQAAGVPFQNAYGGLHLQQGLLTIDYFNTAIESGMVSTKGTWDAKQEQLDVKIEGHNLPIALLTAPFASNLRASGSLEFAAVLTGKTTDPHLSVTATAEHGSILDQPFEQISGVIEYNQGSLFLSNLLAVNNLTTHKIDGSIQISGNKTINLTVATRKARMETILKPLASTEVITGNVDNDLAITGTLDKPETDGLLSLTDGSWRGFLLDSVKGFYRYRNGIVDVENVVVNSLENQVIVDGTVSAMGELAFELTANDLELARLSIPYPYPVSGRARITASLGGTIDLPTWNAKAYVTSLAANGQVFDNVEAVINGSGSAIDCPSASFTQGRSTYKLSGGFNFASNEIYGALKAEKAQASSIAALAKLNETIVQGEVNGFFTWNGTLSNPGATFSGSVVNGVIKGYNLGELEIEASLQDHVINLENLMVKQSEGLMAAKGRIELYGETNIEAGARDIDAAFFSKVFDSTIETTGKLSFTAQVTGKTENPHTAISLEFANGSVAGAGFDNLYGLLVLDKGKIQVDQLLLSKGEYKASAYGVIPLAALNKEGRNRASVADQMNLTVRLDNANLSILPIMTKAVSAAYGETKGEVKVTGDLFQPELSGQIFVKDGSIKFIDLEETIQKVTVDIQFKDDKILVRTFEGAIGAGKYRLTGSAAVRDMELHDYDMTLALNNVTLTHKYFKGPVNGQLSLSEQADMPLIAGQLLLANTTVNVPMSAMPSASGPSAVDIAMNVELVVGDKVRLYNPMLYDVWIEGKVNFQGSLQEPDVSGRIESIRGTLTYLRTQFRLDEAVVAFTQFRSFEPVINLKASTRLEQTNVNLAVDGPVSAMDVKLTSEPQMSQQEILSLLTLRNKFSERQADGKRDTELGHDELVGMLEAGLQLQFFAEVEGMFRNSLGVDEFRLLRGSTTDRMFSDRSATDNDQYKIEIGKYVSDRLLLRYSTGVNSSESSYGARYDITKQINLSADVDEYDELKVGIGMKFRF